MSKFANRSPFGTSQRTAYGISSGPSPSRGGAATGGGAPSTSAPAPANSCSSWPASRNVEEPTPTTSPSDSAASVTRWPLTKVPLVLPRSTMRYTPATLRSSAWWLETAGSATTMSLSGARPMRSTPLGTGRAMLGSPEGEIGSGEGGTGSPAGGIGSGEGGTDSPAGGIGSGAGGIGS